MADIQISKRHDLDLETARRGLEAVAQDLQARFGIDSRWEGNTCRLSGRGIKSGMLELTDGSVSLDLTLGLMAKALKPVILAKIDETFGTLFS